jgi:predicted molibdopterin-dependent oxidoreductase YjgC
MAGRMPRVGETDRTPLTLLVDGLAVQALEGDTLLTAILQAGRRLRQSEFGDGDRAGFCLMGACQDCWVWTAEGRRLRACTTVAAGGMSVCTRQPEATWPNLA